MRTLSRGPGQRVRPGRIRSPLDRFATQRTRCSYSGPSRRSRRAQATGTTRRPPSSTTDDRRRSMFRSEVCHARLVRTGCASTMVPRTCGADRAERLGAGLVCDETGVGGGTSEACVVGDECSQVSVDGCCASEMDSVEAA